MRDKKKANVIDFPTSPSKLERQVEAILFARGRRGGIPLSCRYHTLRPALHLCENLFDRSSYHLYRGREEAKGNMGGGYPSTS